MNIVYFSYVLLALAVLSGMSAMIYAFSGKPWFYEKYRNRHRGGYGTFMRKLQRKREISESLAGIFMICFLYLHLAGGTFPRLLDVDISRALGCFVLFPFAAVMTIMAWKYHTCDEQEAFATYRRFRDVRWDDFQEHLRRKRSQFTFLTVISILSTIVIFS